MLREGGSITMRSRVTGTRDNCKDKKAIIWSSLRGDLGGNQGTKMIILKIGHIREIEINSVIELVNMIIINTQKESKMEEDPSYKMIKE